jgi:hypothetical protein
MEEVPLGAKIIVLAISIAAIVLLATHDKLIKMLCQSFKSSKTR